MATSLTPEQLARLQQLFSTPVESSDPNANAYMPEAVYMDGRTYDKQDSGLLAYDFNPNDFTDPRTQEQQSLFNGSGYDQYGKDGSFTNSGVFTGIQDSNKLGEFLTALTMAAGPVLGGMAMGGAAGAGSGGMVNGAFLGEGALSGIGAWDGALAAAGAGGAAGGGAATMGAGGGGGIGGGAGNGAFLGEGVASGVPAWDAAAAGAGASTGGGLLSSLGGTKNLLGIGSTLLGAAAGAKGQDASSSTTRDIPEWLKPYITGNNGLLSQTQQQLTASRSPERMAQWDSIRNTGLGLMNAPIAGNPTAGWTFNR